MLREKFNEIFRPRTKKKQLSPLARATSKANDDIIVVLHF